MTEKGMGKEGERERLGQSASHADPTGNKLQQQRKRPTPTPSEQRNAET